MAKAKRKTAKRKSKTPTRSKRTGRFLKK